MLINILAQLGNRYRNDRIRGLKSLLFPRERNISNEENRFDYRSRLENVLSSIEWNEKKEKKEKGKGKRGGEETIGEKIRSIMAVKRHVTRSFRLIETVTL